MQKKQNATTPFRNRIALIFDFDGTLGPNTVDYFIEKNFGDPKKFKEEHVKPLKKDGWDSQLANFYALLQAAKKQGLKKDAFEEVGNELDVYDGVMKMFDRVEEAARKIEPEVELEFYLITCSFLDLIKPMPVYKKFKQAHGCEMHFNEEGEASFVRNNVTHPEKVRYLLQIAKGLTDDKIDLPSDAYMDMPKDKWHIPFDQMIYVGDGKSDMPAFSAMKDHGGIALGVVDADKIEEWEGYSAMHSERKVQNLAKADYREDAELLKSILYSVESIAKLLKMRKLGQGE